MSWSFITQPNQVDVDRVAAKEIEDALFRKAVEQRKREILESAGHMGVSLDENEIIGGSYIAQVFCVDHRSFKCGCGEVRHEWGKK